MSEPVAAERHVPVGGVGSRLPLGALLAVVLGLELALNRVLARLLHHELLAPPGWLRSSVDLAGLFLYFFASALAILVAALGLLHVLLQSTIVPRGVRGAMSALAIAFVPLSLLGLCVRLPPQLALYLEASFTALCLVIALSSLASRGRLRAKAALFIVCVPLLLHFGAALFVVRPPTEELARRLFDAGGAATVMTPFALVACLLPRTRRVVAPIVVGVVVTAAVLWLTRFDWDVAARVAGYGFGVEMPMAPARVAIVAAATGCWVALTLALVRAGGPERLRGVSLLLVGLSGYQLVQPGQLAATLVGMLGLLTALEAEELLAEPVSGKAGWTALVTELARALGASSVTASGALGDEEARMRVVRGEETLDVGLERRGGRLALVEIACGVAPSREAAPLALTRKGTSRLGRAAGEPVETGDARFDEAFRVDDARELRGADAILSDEMRPRLVEQVDGWLGIWPTRGVRYRARRSRTLEALRRGEPTAAAELEALITLLVELKSR